MRFEWVLLAAGGLLAAALLPLACSSNGGPTDGGSNRCLASVDCPEGKYCLFGECVDGDAPDGYRAGDSPGDSYTPPADEYSGDSTPPGDTWEPPGCECPGIQDCPDDLGTCEEPTLCLLDQDCIGTNVCVLGKCAAAPTCRGEPGECLLGEDCGLNRNGVLTCCPPGGCPECEGDDAHCPGAQTCSGEGECQNPDICATTSDCFGTLTCESRCDVMDTSGCNVVYGTCGNDVREGAEACDGEDLDGEACQTRGFYSGFLACLPSCTGFDTSGCSSDPGPPIPPGCGNNTVAGNEVCDGGNLNGETCETQSLGGGDLACQQDCRDFDYSDCTDAPVCGDDVLGKGEICDTSRLTLNCDALGFAGGTIACGKSCQQQETCVDDYPNDQENAQLLTLPGGFYTGSLTLCDGDNDWLKVPVDPGDTMVVRARFDIRLGQLLVEWYDGDGPKNTAPVAEFGYLIFGGEDLDSTEVTLDFSLLGAVNRGDRLPVDLEVMVTRACRDDQYEPNDDETVAKTGTNFVFSTCRTDEDWFKIEVASGHSMQAELDTTYGAPMTVEVFQGDLSTRVLYDRREKVNKELRHPEVGTVGVDTTYYLKIYNADDETRAEGELTLTAVPP